MPPTGAARHHYRCLQTLGILLFDGVEVLNFAGLLEVFGTANRLHERDCGTPLFSVVTLAARMWPVSTRGGLSLNPAHDLSSHPPLDVLVAPGGDVSAPLSDPEFVEWIGKTSVACTACVSIGTGAFLLGHAGLLQKKRVAAHREDHAALRDAFPDALLEVDSRYTRDGKVWTSVGVSAGVEMSLALLSSLCGSNLELRVQRQMEVRS